ncbi:hypothetical protein AVEN_275041-1 [Araneus ventricosus]|uniref:Uncharacterized protein n=1 Tax=Araneus ventricosus TaxID=182803 RepID=A0A4Y2EWJ5_ARAVE|nr:hypothetical protein AVEN_275041-1 [Araneus ventricosus]
MPFRSCNYKLMPVGYPKAGHSPPICSNPFGGLHSRSFPFSAHKIWWVIHRSNCANRTYGQPGPLGDCASSSPRFEQRDSRFPRLTPTQTPPPPFLRLLRERPSPPNRLSYFSFMACWAE